MPLAASTLLTMLQLWQRAPTRAIRLWLPSRRISRCGSTWGSVGWELLTGCCKTLCVSFCRCACLRQRLQCGPVPRQRRMQGPGHALVHVTSAFSLHCWVCEVAPAPLYLLPMLQELLAAVSSEEYEEEELDPEWQGLLAQLDARLRGAGKQAMNSKERAVAIRWEGHGWARRGARLGGLGGGRNEGVFGSTVVCTAARPGGTAVAWLCAASLCKQWRALSSCQAT